MKLQASADIPRMTRTTGYNSGACCTTSQKTQNSILGEKNGFIRGVLRHLTLLNIDLVSSFRGA